MSDDILSGGRIDESTSGPAPSKRDDRSRDILAEQKEQQEQNAVGGTQFPPKVEPLPPIPTAPEIAPPLPATSSFDFNFSGSVLEEVREISRQAMVDAFKNVTINGQSPSIDGATISFTVQPQQPSASEMFSFQNGELNLSNLPAATIPPPELRPQDGTRSVVVPSPSRQREVQEPEQRGVNSEDFGTGGNAEFAKPAYSNLSDYTTFEERPQQQPREDVQSAVVPSPSRQREDQEPEQRGVNSEDFGTGGNAEFAKPAYSNLSDYTTFGKPPEETQERPSRLDADDFGSGPRLSEDRPSRLDDADFGTQKGMEDNSTKEAYAAAEARKDARRESDPDFDRESDTRQRGESRKDFAERQERLKEERIAEAKQEGLVKRAREGDMTEVPTGMIPVVFDRADGQNKILALLATEFVGTVEGGSSETRMVGLPPETEYYLGGGGGGGGCIGLALYKKTVGTPPNTSTEVWIGAGTVAGDLPPGFDNSEGGIIAGGGSGNVWAEVNVSQTTGEVVSVAVTGGGTTPPNSDTAYYYTLGYYLYTDGVPTVTNYGCGSVDVRVCRNWFAAESPYYGVSVTRCGCGGY